MRWRAYGGNVLFKSRDVYASLLMHNDVFQGGEMAPFEDGGE